MLPGFQRSFSNLNGPEPTYSEICSFAEVSAIRFGIMNGTLELGFASDSSTRPYGDFRRSEEHTSELQSLMRISYAVFCLKKKKKNIIPDNANTLQDNTTNIDE